jgi:Lrp/AsnC family transcriptional regulator, regulator for asnA, asnC and gidA
MDKPVKKKPPILDNLDKEIIQELQLDARESYLSLGKKVNASEGTVRNRVAQALKKDIIRLKAVLNPPKLGFTFSCVMGLEIDIDKLGTAESALAECPNVYFLSGCTGTFDLIAMLIFRNTAEFDKFTRDKIARLPGIKRTQTFVNMRIVKNPWTQDVDISRLLDA